MLKLRQAKNGFQLSSSRMKNNSQQQEVAASKSALKHSDI